MLHPQNVVPSVLMPSDKPVAGPVPINSNFSTTPAPVQAPPRSEFPQMVPPVIQHATSQPPVFASTIVLKLLLLVKLHRKESCGRSGC